MKKIIKNVFFRLKYYYYSGYVFYKKNTKKLNTSCNIDGLRCGDDKNNANYQYYLFGKDTPSCCASNLVKLLFFADEIFRENNIEYFIVFGTFLGAIRHKGLIPWDTDVDLAIKHTDLDKVVELLKKETKELSYKVVEGGKEKYIRLYYSEKNNTHIDFFLTEKDTNTLYLPATKSRHVEIPLEDVYPLKEYKFYNKKVFGPRTNEMLFIEYGRDVLKSVYRQWAFNKEIKEETSFSRAKINLEDDNR